MFQGFSPMAIDFLWGIRMNNNREWFQNHKSDYQNFVYEPMKQLSREVFREFERIPNMDYKLSRIYKDARLHPAVPYKESLWFSMRPENCSWSEQPTLYFEITPEGCSYGAVLFMPKPAALERYRRRLTANPKEFPALVKKLKATSGLPLTGESYHRKKPCPEESLEPYYQLKNFQLCREIEPGEQMFCPELAENVIRTLKALYPFYEYFLRFTQGE